MTQYDYNEYCDAHKLTREIGASAIVTALDHITTSANTTAVVFKAELSSGDETILDGLVTAHDNTPEAPIETLYDSDGAQIIKTKTTRAGWHYEPRSIDFLTSVYNSHYNRKHNGGDIDSGTDYGDAVMKFYNASDTELVKGGEESVEDFQIRLTANCTKTYLDWQPTYIMDIIGGMLQVLQAPTERAYVWAIIAPDIPEAYGGSVPFLAGGFNLQFFKAGNIEHFVGRGVKEIVPDFVYNTNKFRIIVKHPTGVQIGLQLYFEHFKA